ncbi:MAG: putative colanic acid biosynthesis acetyltransferase [Candidatus Obscuribacterales bacterium]|nr:putative colanic acid biosynthesis acetyltransferase [Candidatus Obscuribacterales bacterium]
MTEESKLFTYENSSSRHQSPRALKEILLCEIFQLVWFLFCSFSPRPLNRWRTLILRIFGAKLEGNPKIHPSCQIAIPWNLSMAAGSSIGARANIYNLAQISIAENATVAQETFLCTGTHKFDDPLLPLQTAPIKIGKEAFICARAFVLPGVTIGDGAIVGAQALISRDIPDWSVWAGNPAKEISKRSFTRKNESSH